MGCHLYLHKPNGREIAIPSIRVPGKLEGRVWNTREEALAFVEELRQRKHCCERSPQRRKEGRICSTGCIASERNDQGTWPHRLETLSELEKTIRTCDFGKLRAG